jgi:hypothetical protein
MLCHIDFLNIASTFYHLLSSLSNYIYFILAMRFLSVPL